MNQKFSWCLLFVLLFFFALPTGMVRSEKAAKKVLILYSYGADLPVQTLFTQGLRETLKETGGNTEYIYEYLDMARYTSQENYETLLAEFLQQKYSQNQPDLIVTHFVPACNFMIHYGPKIFPKVPAILSFYEGEGEQHGALPPNYYDVIGTYGIDTAVNLILKTRPQTKNIYVIAGDSPRERQAIAVVKREVEEFTNQVTFTYLNKQPFAQMTETVATAEPNSAVLFLFLFKDAAGQAFIPGTALQKLHAVSPVPIYGSVSIYLGQGTVGGYMESQEVLGARSGKIAAQLLNKTAPVPETLQRGSAAEYLFDARELKRWQISEDTLPVGSKILFKTPSFWETYRWYVLAALLLLLVESILIIALLLNRHYRKQAEARAHDEAEKQAKLQEQMEKQLKLAEEVQRSLLPQDCINRKFLLKTLFRPLSIVSGDFYGYRLSDDEQHLHGFLLDVTGHGVSASLHTAAINNMIGFYLNQTNPWTLENLAKLNEQLLNYFQDSSLAALLVFTADFNQHTLTCLSCGINTFLVSTQNKTGLISLPGMYLGISQKAQFNTLHLPLQYGDTFYFMTDGIYDNLPSNMSEQAGNFEKSFTNLAQMPLGQLNPDDRTALCLKILNGKKRPLYFDYSNKAERRNVLYRMNQFLCECTGTESSQLSILLGEALTNAVKQGSRVRVKINVIGARLILRVSDNGPGFAGNAAIKELQKLSAENIFIHLLEAEQGRGLAIMLLWSEKFLYNRQGNELLLVYALPQKNN
ncbi:MAG: SpoIIE family protein phosphatase [Sporomusaceae bacterium]|nr:SpoIIE family protein phosphatase [Sporomusaceae bacterium]